MKKAIKFLTVLFLAGTATTFVSCSSDESEDSSDPIIGKWKMTERLENGVSTFDSCAALNIYEFKADGTMTAQDFEDEGNGCEDNIPAGMFFNWEKLGDNSYKYIIPGFGIVFEFETEFSGNTLIVTGTDDGEPRETHFVKQ